MFWYYALFICYLCDWKSCFEEYPCRVEEIWKQHNFLKWPIGSMEWWQVIQYLSFKYLGYYVLYFFQQAKSCTVDIKFWYSNRFRCSVLQNISESIISLVTEEGKNIWLFWIVTCLLHAFRTLYIDFFLLLIFLGAHHIDLRASTENDPDWLIEQRATEIKLIQGWISDYNKKNKAVFDM